MFINNHKVFSSHPYDWYMLAYAYAINWLPKEGHINWYLNPLTASKYKARHFYSLSRHSPFYGLVNNNKKAMVMTTVNVK